MHKSNTTRRKLYILVVSLLFHEMGGGGAYSKGGTYFKFWLIGGALN